MGNLFSLDAWMMVWHFKETFILGFLTTIGVSLSALLISLYLGIIFGLMATSGKMLLLPLLVFMLSLFKIPLYCFRSVFILCFVFLRTQYRNFDVRYYLYWYLPWSLHGRGYQSRHSVN